MPQLKKKLTPEEQRKLDAVANKVNPFASPLDALKAITPNNPEPVTGPMSPLESLKQRYATMQSKPVSQEDLASADEQARQGAFLGNISGFANQIAGTEAPKVDFGAFAKIAAERNARNQQAYENEARTNRDAYALERQGLLDTQQADLQRLQQAKLQKELLVKPESPEEANKRDLQKFAAQEAIKAQYATPKASPEDKLATKEAELKLGQKYKAPNESQSNAAAYAMRALEANKDLEKNLFDNTGVTSYIGEILPNIAKSAERQQFENSRSLFTRAILRKESGATVSDSEQENADRLYFPKPGDAPEVVEQKKRNRLLAIKGLVEGSSPTSSVKQETKIINGKTYIKVPGGWEEQ